MSRNGNVILPLTIGMLSSALMRYDHGLFAPWSADDAIQALQGPPGARIRSAIDEVMAFHENALAGLPALGVTERQVREEFDGTTGYWRPEREEAYADALTPYGLKDHAVARIERRNRRGREAT